MCRIRPSVLLLALVMGSNCQAAGSFQTKPAFSNVVSASYSTAPAAVSGARTNIPVIDIGCGKGRFRDSQTRSCRGPADIR